MNEKMTYEKLFKALQEGRRIKGIGCSENFVRFCAGNYLVDQDEIEYPYLADKILQNGIESFEIIEEPKPYDMTYKEALLYMLEKPGVHCVSAPFNPEEKIHLHSEYFYFMGDMISDYKDTGLRSVTEDFYDAKWRKEPDLVCNEPGTDTDVATKNFTPEILIDKQRLLVVPEYKKGDKLLTPAEVFKALLAGRKVTLSDWGNEDGLFNYLVIVDGEIWWEHANCRRSCFENKWDFESSNNNWWEIAE